MPIYTGAILAVIAWLLEYSYLCNQCLSPLMLSVRISIRARCTILCDKVCQWLATCDLRLAGTPFPQPIIPDRPIELKYCWKWREHHQTNIYKVLVDPWHTLCLFIVFVVPLSYTFTRKGSYAHKVFANPCHTVPWQESLSIKCL
jgi:hypothetical protein